MSSKKSANRTKKTESRLTIPEAGLGRRLWDYLQLKKWDIANLVTETGIPKTTVFETIFKNRKLGFDHLQNLILKTDISSSFLFTGEGPMTRTSSGASQQPLLNIDADPLDRDLLQKTHSILNVRTSVARDALASNINYFYDAVRREMVLQVMAKKFDTGLQALFGSSISDVLKEVDAIMAPPRAGPDPLKEAAPASDPETSSSSILQNEKPLPRRHIAIPKAK